MPRKLDEVESIIQRWNDGNETSAVDATNYLRKAIRALIARREKKAFKWAVIHPAGDYYCGGVKRLLAYRWEQYHKETRRK